MRMRFISQVCLHIRGICYSDRSSTVQQNDSNRTQIIKNNIQIYTFLQIQYSWLNTALVKIVYYYQHSEDYCYVFLNLLIFQWLSYWNHWDIKILSWTWPLLTLWWAVFCICILLVQPCSKAIFISYLILCNIDKTDDSPEIHGCVASVYVCEICVCECVSDTHGNGWDDGYGLSPLTKCRRTGAVFVLVTPWQKLRAHQDLHLGCQPKWPEWSLSALDSNIQSPFSNKLIFFPSPWLQRCILIEKKL